MAKFLITLYLCYPNIGTDVKVDGTKIKASAADDQTYKKSDLEERKRAIQQEILEYLRSGIELDWFNPLKLDTLLC